MSSQAKNLDAHSSRNMINITGKRFAIIVSEWNIEVTGALRSGAQQALESSGALPKDIIIRHVPGTFELPLAAQWSASNHSIDAIICIGCVIKGETQHFDFICQAAAQGIKDVGLKFNKPVIFGVLTPNTQQQALDRAGGKHGNKGTEAAISAIKMLGLVAD